MLSQFFGISGRINRGQWWVVQLTTLAIGFVLNFLMLDVTTEMQQVANIENPDPKAAMAVLGKAGGMAFVGLGWVVISQWIFISSGIQRLHDRNSSGWRMLFAYAPLGLIGLSVYFLVAQQAWTAAGLAAIMALAGMALSMVWMTIEFGMLPGDDFENDFGDPPSSNSGRSALEKELATLRGDDAPAGSIQPSPAMAIAAPQNRFQAPSGPVTFGRR